MPTWAPLLWPLRWQPPCGLAKCGAVCLGRPAQVATYRDCASWKRLKRCFGKASSHGCPAWTTMSWLYWEDSRGPIQATQAVPRAEAAAGAAAAAVEEAAAGAIQWDLASRPTGTIVWQVRPD
mmetsp:Transcript_111420/g.270710  ORF Transcript_111420/g.270710 Transcript_111420/m.270710 type:complete len:123 (-) Transcript_111420:228-596(-)